jgi:glyoxylase-like metal-dependent hydrolase (beta-lactamase superfamily II)
VAVVPEQIPGHGTAAGPQITVTGTLQAQAWRDRVLPPVEQVRGDVWSIPTPFPYSPLRYVLSYLIETSKGVVLVDTGWHSPEAWDGLVSGILQSGHELADVTTVLVTHFHGDHIGLAYKVRKATGAQIALHRLDDQMRKSFGGSGGFRRKESNWLLRRGVSEDEIDEMVPRAGNATAPSEPDDGTSPLDPLGDVDILLEDRDYPLGRDVPIRVHWSPGHTPGHSCFVHEGHDVLLSGDHILPRISPNISPAPSVEDDTLGEYLGSLRALGSWHAAEVLPAHEYRFQGLPERVRQLLDHHERRLSEVVEAVGQHDGCHTLDVAELLTWSRPWSESRGIVRRSAIGETYAHLVHLASRGLITNTPDGVDHWRLTAAADRVRAAVHDELAD